MLHPSNTESVGLISGELDEEELSGWMNKILTYVQNKCKKEIQREWQFLLNRLKDEANFAEVKVQSENRLYLQRSTLKRSLEDPDFPLFDRLCDIAAEWGLKDTAENFIQPLM